MKNIDQIRFQIDQLRKDKIIYAVEAIAVNTCCMIIFLLININSWFTSESTRGIISNLTLIIGAAYTIYMGIGNLLRLQKIKKLEKLLTKITP